MITSEWKSRVELESRGTKWWRKSGYTGSFSLCLQTYPSPLYSFTFWDKSHCVLLGFYVTNHFKDWRCLLLCYHDVRKTLEYIIFIRVGKRCMFDRTQPRMSKSFLFWFRNTSCLHNSSCLPMAGDKVKHLFPSPLLNTLDSLSQGFVLFVCPTRQNLWDVVVDALLQEIVRSWVGQDRKCIMGRPFCRDVERVGRDKSKRERKETWWSAVFFHKNMRWHSLLNLLWSSFNWSSTCAAVHSHPCVSM